MSEAFEILFMFIKAFAIGGLICTLAQLVINFTDLTAGKILVLFMLLGIGLTALGLYQPLVEFAGAGATVPISGFGYLLANGAMRARRVVSGVNGFARRRKRGRFCGGNIFFYYGSYF